MGNFYKAVAPLLLLFFIPAFASAASLTFSPSSGTFNRGENFTVGVYMDSDTPVNAVQNLISFPTEHLELVKIESTGSSIIDLWVQKPSFSNAGTLGNARLEGVVLSPGFTGRRGKIVDIVFRVRKEGTANLNFTEYSILANDGSGTSVSVDTGTATFTLKAAVTPPIKKEVVPADIVKIEEKINAVEDQVRDIGSTIVLNTPKPVTGLDSIYEALNKLPQWLRVCVFIFLIIACVVLFLILLGLALVLLLWLWSYINRNWRDFVYGAQLFFRRNKDRYFMMKEDSKEEFIGDVNYTKEEIKREFKEVMYVDTLWSAIAHYVALVGKIFVRFFTKNRDTDKKL